MFRRRFPAFRNKIFNFFLPGLNFKANHHTYPAACAVNPAPAANATPLSPYPSATSLARPRPLHTADGQTSHLMAQNFVQKVYNYDS
jgi:hypothetical protein